MSNSTISGNKVIGGGGDGGGIYNDYHGILTVTNSTFSGNSANASGGGIYNRSRPVTVSNCVFSGNSAGWGGAGIYNSWDGSGMMTVDSSIFTG